METFNILHSAFNAEIKDIRDATTAEMSASGKYLYDDGSIVLPVSSEVSEHQVFMVLNDRLVKEESREVHTLFSNKNTFMDGIVGGHTLQRIDKLSIKSLIMIVDRLVKEGKGDFYGIMVSNGEQRFNILHPVIAMMIVKGVIRFDGEISAVIFRYPTKKEIDENTSSMYQEQIIDLTTSIVNTMTPPRLSLSPRESLREDIHSFTVNQEHRIRMRESSTGIENVAIPVQLASSGISFPWYGLILARRDGGAYASSNMYPMLSGNISTAYLSGRGSTCTGNHDSSMYSSLFTLGNMNINSMYYNNTVPPHVEDFVDACHEVSIQILNIYAGELR